MSKKPGGNEKPIQPKGSEPTQNQPPPTSGLDFSSSLQLPDLKEKPFPCKECFEFRVHFRKPVFEEILSHANEDKKVELCGVLVGNVCKDSGGPYLLIEESIRGVGAKNDGAQVTFTHATWDHIHRQMEEKFKELRIVGWYHTHPGFGIFLSEMDKFIHDYFFNQAFQVALVVDPISKGTGIFFWKGGRIQSLARAWVGESSLQLTSGHVGSDFKKPEIANDSILISKTGTENLAGDSKSFSIFKKVDWLSVFCLFIALLAGGLATDFFLRNQIRKAFRESANAEIREIMGSFLGAISQRDSFEAIKSDLIKMETSLNFFASRSQPLQSLKDFPEIRRRILSQCEEMSVIASVSNSFQKGLETASQGLLEIENSLSNSSNNASSTDLIPDFSVVLGKIQTTRKTISEISSSSVPFESRITSTSQSLSEVASQLPAETMEEPLNLPSSKLVEELHEQLNASKSLLENLASASGLREEKFRAFLAEKVGDGATINQRISEINGEIFTFRQIVALGYFLQVQKLLAAKGQGSPDNEIIQQARSLMVLATKLAPSLETQFRMDCPILFDPSAKGADQ